MTFNKLDKIKDEKFKNILIQYKETQSHLLLLLLLREKNIIINTEKIGGIIVEWKEDENDIWLGGVIIDGELYKALLHIYDDGEVVLDFFHDYNIAIKVNGDQDGN
jgi:hypothetical protein